MTQTQFANELGVSRTSLSGYEGGRTEVPLYIEKLIQFYIEARGVEEVLKEKAVLEEKKAALERELKKLDADLERDAERRSRNSRDPLPGVEGVS